MWGTRNDDLDDGDTRTRPQRPVVQAARRDGQALPRGKEAVQEVWIFPTGLRAGRVGPTATSGLWTETGEGTGSGYSPIRPILRSNT
jgi:hypothetical protein